MPEPKETTEGKYAYRFTIRFLSNIGHGCIGKQSEMFYISDSEFDEDDWDNLSEEARQKFLNERLQEWKAKLTDCGWKEAASGTQL